MQPNTVASFLIFILTGIYSFWITSDSFTNFIEIKVFLFFAIFFNIIYYFYFEAFIELDSKIKESLKKASRWEWIIRVINQTLLFSLLFLIQYSLKFFAIALILLYLSYLIWDIIKYKCFERKALFILDIFCFFFTIIFIWLGYVNLTTNGETPSEGSRAIQWRVIWAISVVIYMIFPIIGMFITNFNPFKKEYWR